MFFSATNLSFLFLLTFLSHMPINASLQEDCSTFIGVNLQGLRESRSELKRLSVPFSKTVEILEFLEGENTKYGTEALTDSPQFYDLLVDLCDIVNLQHPDFKKRYDVFVEQLDGNDQKPFSLFSFDRIAQLFHFRDSLFNHEKASYKALMADIVSVDLPALKGALILIRDLDAVHKGLPASTPLLDELNAHLNQLALKTAAERAAEQKAIRRKAPPPRIKRLYVISAMAHDYLTLNRLEEASNLVLSVKQFAMPQEREAFLAGMIQIGELSTNKNLSSFMKSFMPTIPWQDFVHCRNAIEHQDEHGFHGYFKGIIDGTNASVDFTAWCKEMEILKKRIAEVRQKIWGMDPKAHFEAWLASEMSNVPTYGVIAITSSPVLEKSVYKVFRQTPLFNGNAELWKTLLTGEKEVKVEHLKTLRDEVRNYAARIPTMPDGSKKEEREKKNAQKYLKAYEDAKTYLWERLNNAANHLEAAEKDMLIKMATDHFDRFGIVNMCLALLKMDQSFLTESNSRAFVTAALPVGIIVGPILEISKRFQPQMPITRLVRTALLFDNAIMTQADRFTFAHNLFAETSTHLHYLAHGPDFEARLQTEMTLLPIKYAFHVETKRNPKAKALEEEIGKIHAEHSVEDEYGYYCLTPFGQALSAYATLSSGIHFTFPTDPTEPGFAEFSKQTINEFYRRAHRVHLPSAIPTNPVTYMASVYTISVGYSALKGWVSREQAPLIEERAALETLREGRNFIAHGDLFRQMNGIDLADVQESLLTDHLYRCTSLRFT